MRHLLVGLFSLALFSIAVGCIPIEPEDPVCTKEYAPVCGVDGKTYGNKCMLDAANVKLDYVGECKIACTKEYFPMCGVDGKTYGNKCMLEAAGVKLDYQGECKKFCGGWLGDTCDEDEYCAYEPGQYCGAADASSVCKKRPQVCTLQYDPVCGCDGKTYGNSCSAATHGTGVMKKGPCKIDVVGDWSGKGPNWPVEFTFSKDGSFTKRDLVSPCPIGAVCVWSGIVDNSGKYSYDSFSDTLYLTFSTSNDHGGNVTLPKYLKIDTDAFTLTESLNDGGSIVYYAK